MHNILEPIAAPAKKEESSSDDDSDSDNEVVEKVADKVEELVEKVEEKVIKGDVVEKVVAKVDNVVAKVEQVVDNVNEVIQMEETPKVEGMLDQKTWILHKSLKKLVYVFASSNEPFLGICIDNNYLLSLREFLLLVHIWIDKSNAWVIGTLVRKSSMHVFVSEIIWKKVGIILISNWANLYFALNANPAI